jgi:general L-amino acid transport system ATP-binding protein
MQSHDTVLESRSETAVAMSAVQKWFGQIHVLKGIDLEVASGERVVICGPSGSGKSTLIRCLNGLEEHDEGTILIHGTIACRDNAASLRRHAGMVFQSFNLFPHKTVLENCTVGPVHALGLPRKGAEERARHYLARVHVLEHARKYPAQLSGGQQQRVAIARALSMEPRIMLFDEPTSALDPEMIREVVSAMEDLAASGMTMICVTHEMGFARRVADRIVFVDQGRIVENCSPSSFFSRTANARVQAFLAQMGGSMHQPGEAQP